MGYPLRVTVWQLVTILTLCIRCKFMTSTEPLLQFGSFGTGAGGSINHGVSYADDGNIWVTDHNNHRVQIFDGNGTYLSQFGGFSLSPALNNPSAMAMDLQNYYFSDSDNDQVVVMKQEDGAYIRRIASGGTALGKVLNPKGITLDGLGRIYVGIMKMTGCRC